MRKRKNVVVELTSLLDVIFIMLFMVMNQSRSTAAEAEHTAESAVAAAEVRVAEAETKAEEYRKILNETAEERENLEYIRNRLSGYEIFSEYAQIITVYIVDEGYKRSIRVADDSEIAAIDFDWDNMDYGRKTLSAELEKFIDSTENPVFITFTYDSNRIFRQDYNMISETITAVQAQHEDVYIKFNDKTGGTKNE